MERRFEWDPAKSAANRHKHGIDFEEAQALWDDPQRTEGDVNYTGLEQRRLHVARINGKFYTAFTTMRGGIIRIISVRRSRKKEIAGYERQKPSSD
jgi:uncharacterized DUF497 family protein